ncbi:Hypothetical predicted protein [Paramuricea clavata]|uniref:Uncharacterized protein n=1 Tax=Paramuricea clavata TaxID=317549 RepID=A0A6S7IGY6_PARCT|nr:Hypothetical predicted protein [Paramuricea clavata]
MKIKPLSPPPGIFVHQDLYSRRRWRRAQYLADQFWIRWKNEYLQSLQSRSKWNKRHPNLEVGDIVLMKDDTLWNLWPMGRITKAIKSEDGKVRKAEVMVYRHGEKKTYTRPIGELILLLNNTQVSSECTISSITLTPEEVYHVLAAPDENKATGPDKIPAKLLKNCASSIYLSLCDLFNKSLSMGKLPNEWKLSNIVPIPKKGPAEEVSNYRPISLLSLVSKVFEHCVCNQLVSHISTQLHRLQFGFLRGKSTTSQLLHILQDIHQALESGNQVDAVYLDFAKAFDKVSHKLLLTKLHKFGIRGDLLSWFENYLSGRYQIVTVLGETSGTLPVLSGVPRGSILGSLLFLVYVNDFHIPYLANQLWQCLLMIQSTTVLQEIYPTAKVYRMI